MKYTTLKKTIKEFEKVTDKLELDSKIDSEEAMEILRSVEEATGFEILLEEFGGIDNTELCLSYYIERLSVIVILKSGLDYNYKINYELYINSFIGDVRDALYLACALEKIRNK